METFADIISLWPSTRELALDLGAEEQDVAVAMLRIRAWRARNSIPVEYWQDMVDAAKKRGIALDYEQFHAAVAKKRVNAA